MLERRLSVVLELVLGFMDGYIEGPKDNVGEEVNDGFLDMEGADVVFGSWIVVDVEVTLEVMDEDGDADAETVIEVEMVDFIDKDGVEVALAF